MNVESDSSLADFPFPLTYFHMLLAKFRRSLLSLTVIP